MAFLDGDLEGARADAEQLMQMTPTQVSDLAKAAQSFAFMGFDVGVKWAFEEAKRRQWLDTNPNDTGVLFHYYGTALARAGDVKSAATYWKQSVKLCKDATCAEDNLHDMKLPVAERSGPAYFSLREWLSRSLLDELKKTASVIDRKHSPHASAADAWSKAARGFLTKHPDFERWIPAMLDTCDAHGIQFLCITAPFSRRPAVREALIQFLQGSRGSDQLRFQLLTTLQEQGYPLDTPLQMYARGKKDLVEAIGFEIVSEVQHNVHSEEVLKLYEPAMRALQNNDGVTAESYFRRILEIAPDKPDVYNNLAMALQLQNRFDESLAMVDDLVERFPDYFFGKLAMANRLIQAKKFDEALKTLFELQRRKQLHMTEFTGLASAMIRALVGKNDFEGAKRWISMFEEVQPDNAQLQQLKRLVNASGIWGLLRQR